MIYALLNEAVGSAIFFLNKAVGRKEMRMARRRWLEDVENHIRVLIGW
jgi:hypothetical protein